MAEWKMFRRVMFSHVKSADSDETKTLLCSLLKNPTVQAAFPNLSCLVSIGLVLPVTTASVERSFSDMKLIKTRLRNRLGEDSLDRTLRISIEGPQQLSEDALEAILDNWKERKPRRISV